MGRPRATSNASTNSTSAHARDQELGSMYDYLAKIILLGPSGAGKSCILHRFVKNEWRILSSQTIGVEFASKIVHLGRPPHRTRIKLQLWDTAGTERFRSVSRSYYRGAAGAILVYDINSWRSFEQLRTFLDDARALAGPDLTVILAGNKSDAAEGESSAAGGGEGAELYGSYASSTGIDGDTMPPPTPNSTRSTHTNSSLGLSKSATVAPDGREVPAETASRWAGNNGISVAVEVSALNGENVEELFNRLARMILTKIELGEIDPDDPTSGIQYGDIGGWGYDDGNGSVRSAGAGADEGVRYRRRNKKGAGAQLREWEDVFRISGTRRGGCC
ncbi:P-loop containing nucleoside triphosphate hydrolase protein [Clohesyomyces aquaticus]|uniref:p-loop containing nucleoside triphosphate hydrolase protein n=1 Tax=Clohesyomyces aquaticus TaxID=1231657 RepID=A0A1Y1ZQX9_9PLEO|nr:P-loop containing nucleoside triphosphate hydrolase protein [Clohesyomyces aquaticus]